MEQSDLLAYVVDTLERLNITYMLVGSLASGAYGEPRLTQDIDVVIDVTPSQVQSLCAAFDPAQFYVSPQAALQALRTPAGQFNVIDPESGNKVDFMIARGDAWGRVGTRGAESKSVAEAGSNCCRARVDTSHVRRTSSSAKCSITRKGGPKSTCATSLAF